MQYKKILNTNLNISVLGLGTWAFGSDKWWGWQSDSKSEEVLETAFENGVNLIDTAPVYGRGHSQTVIGRFLRQNKIREKIVLADKLGLRWHNRKVEHNLSKKSMLEEIDLSRKRLCTDYIDIYQVHWPDPDTPIAETAAVMEKFYAQGIIKAVGLSNYSLKQIQEFRKYCPVHILQMPYNMFERNIEIEIAPFCLQQGISLLVYSPLDSGILTGKFFFEKQRVPKDLRRKYHSGLKAPLLTINNEFFKQAKDIALNYNASLAQLALNWCIAQSGITSVLAGARNIAQIKDNLLCFAWKPKQLDLAKINELLEIRKREIKKSL